MRVCVPLYVLRVLLRHARVLRVRVLLRHARVRVLWRHARVRRHVLRSWFPPTLGLPGTPPRCVYL